MSIESFGSLDIRFINRLGSCNIKAFGSSPEYTMYSILIGNMFMPLIAMLTRPMPFGKKEAIEIQKSQKYGGKQ